MLSNLMFLIHISMHSKNARAMAPEILMGPWTPQGSTGYRPSETPHLTNAYAQATAGQASLLQTQLQVFAFIPLFVP